MNLEEKLEDFYITVIDSATNQGISIVEEYRKTLQKIFDEHQKAAYKKAENTFRIETDNIIQEKNRRLSEETLNLRRKVLDRSEHFTGLLFEEVKKMLEEFMKTPSYQDYMTKKIKEAYDFAQGDEIILYINETDGNLKPLLEAATGLKLKISDRDFLGGIRAVLPLSSVLIDHSLLTKLNEAKNSFAF